MRFSIYYLLFLLSSFTSYSQEIKQHTKILECSDISNEASVQFIQFVNQSKYDSAQQVLTFWERKCGLREPIFRCQIILLIAQNKGVDSLINNESMYYLHCYRSRNEMIKKRDFSSYDYNKPYYGFVPIGQELDQFTITFFDTIKQRQKPQSTNFLVCDFYSSRNDTLFALLQSEDYHNTLLSKEYFGIVKRYINKPETHTACYVGAWIPTGGIVHLGVHPEIGLQAGVKYKRLNIDFTVAFKFLKAVGGYYASRVNSDQSLVHTNHFFGGYIGLDGGYDIWRTKHQELQILVGIGGDGFDAIKEDKSKQLKPESAWSYNFNGGIGYRYYIKNSFYIGVKAKYNIVNYALNGVVGFTGNPITAGLVIGGLSNRTKRTALESLHYKWNR